MASISNAGRRVLIRAAQRPRENICPVVDANVKAATETALIEGLERRGFIRWDGVPWKTAPRISDAGRALVEA